MKVVQYQYLQKNNFRTCVSHVQICFSFEAKMHNCGFFRTHLRNCHNVFFVEIQMDFRNGNFPIPTLLLLRNSRPSKRLKLIQAFRAQPLKLLGGSVWVHEAASLVLYGFPFSGLGIPEKFRFRNCSTLPRYLDTHVPNNYRGLLVATQMFIFWDFWYMILGSLNASHLLRGSTFMPKSICWFSGASLIIVFCFWVGNSSQPL